MPTKSLNALALPLVISFTFRFLFTLVDLVFVRAIRDESPEGVAAIGLFIPIQTLFIAIWVGLSAGFTASISQAFGRRDETRVKALKGAMVRILAGLVPLLLALAAVVWFTTPLLKLSPSLERDFLTYSLILICSMPFAGFLSMYPDSIVKAHHDTISTMKAGLYSTFTNVALNALFVFVFHWGIAGIAVATVLSRYTGLIYAGLRTRALEAARRTEDWDQGATKWDRGPLLDILALGMPGCLAYTLIFGEEWILTMLLTQEDAAEVYLASVAVYNRLAALSVMPAVATAVAVLPFVARLAAEKRVAEVRRDLGRSLLLTGGLVMAIAIPVGWLFPEALAGYFIGEKAAKAGADVTLYLTLIPFVALISLPYLLLRPVFEALGMPRLGVRITLLKSLLFGIPMMLGGYFLARALGSDPLLGLLIGVLGGQLCASLVTAWFCNRMLLECGGAETAAAEATAAGTATVAGTTPGTTPTTGDGPDEIAKSAESM